MYESAAARCAIVFALVASLAASGSLSAAERVVINPATGLPSFIGGREIGPRGTPGVSGESIAADYLAHVAGELGIRSLRVELEPMSTESVNGFSRYRYRQLYQGFPVHGAEVSIVVNDQTGAFAAANSSYVPAITLSNPAPSLRAAEAIRIVKRIVPSARVVNNTAKLVLLPADKRDDTGEHRLAWLVELYEDPRGYVPISKTYAVDATDGFVLDSIEHLNVALDREVVDKTSQLTRTEGQGSAGSNEADKAYDLLGKIHDYFLTGHSWDSWDGAGVRLKAHVNDSAVATGNAYFSSRFGGFKFAPAMIHTDVTAHEFTHGVVNATAKLAYKYESGALNESFADVFGALIDGDYLIGETISLELRKGYGPDASGGTRRALRNMADPAEMNQPDHTSVFKALCANEDHGGVHVNSGIPNKAFHNISSKLGAGKTGRIYFQALSTYLKSDSTLADARAALEQAAADMYPNDAKVLQAVTDGLDAVGMTANFVRPEKDGCSIFGGFADGCPVQRLARQQRARASGNAGLTDQIVAAYRLRDDFFRKNPGFADYFMPLYNKHTGTMAKMVVTDADFAKDAGRLMKQLTRPILAMGTAEERNTEVSKALLETAGSVVAQLETQLRSQGDAPDADELRQQYDQLNPGDLAGKSVADAVEEVRKVVDPGSANKPSDRQLPDPATRSRARDRTPDPSRYPSDANGEGEQPAEEEEAPTRY